MSKNTKLDRFEVSNNSLSGEISEDIFKLESLQFLYLNSNQFEGGIPDNFGGNRNLVDLFLNDNLLTGSIPEIEDDGSTLLNIQEILLNGNKFMDAVPSSICDRRISQSGTFVSLHADCDRSQTGTIQNQCQKDCCTRCFVGKL